MGADLLSEMRRERTVDQRMNSQGRWILRLSLVCHSSRASCIGRWLQVVLEMTLLSSWIAIIGLLAYLIDCMYDSL